VRPQLVGRAVRVVALEGENPVIIVGEPGDEIAEAWHDFSSLAIVWFVLNAFILAILYVVLGRLLDPLAHLSTGMLNLEDGHYATRLARPKVKELALITERFNTLAGALDTARDENSRLYRQLITVQEEERRVIADELHDEAGPCLFGITANASSIARLADKAPEPCAGEIKSRVAELLVISERLKTINRDLLRRLRPVELGRISLKEVIESLVAGFLRRHPEVDIAFTPGALARSYGEGVDLTVFRCVQEALTNAMRHGGASHIGIELGELKDINGSNGSGPVGKLRLVVDDDGEGFAPGVAAGLGLTAMRERVRTVDGTSHIDSSPAGGTTITVLVPLRSATATSARPEQSQMIQSAL
jgi:two-component system sensor histidine kinase UhpB